MKVWNEGSGLSRWAPALRDPPRDARASGSCRRSHLRDARGWNIFPRGESLRELSQRRGFAEALSGIFPLFGGEACKKRAAEAMQPQWCWGFLGPAVVCAVVSHLAGLGMLVLAAAGAPGPRSCSAGDGAERGPRDGTGESGFGSSTRCWARRKVMGIWLLKDVQL